MRVLVSLPLLVVGVLLFVAGAYMLMMFEALAPGWMRGWARELLG